GVQRHPGGAEGNGVNGHRRSFRSLQEEVEPAGGDGTDGTDWRVALRLSGGRCSVRAADGRAALSAAAPTRTDADVAGGEAGVGQCRAKVGEGGREEPAGG